MLYRIFLAALLTAALTMLASCAEDETVTLVLDWVPNTNHTGFYVALERGYFEEEGITLEIVQPPEDGALPLVAAGHAEFGISFQEEVTVGVNSAFDMPIIAIAALVEHNTSGVISMTDRNIRRFRDLEGRTFGSWQIDIYDEIIREAIRMDGGDPDLVEFVPNMALDNLTGIRREFDATWVFEGWDVPAAEAEGLDVNFFALRDTSPVFDYFTPVLVTHNDLADSDLALRFMRASARGFEFARDNPREAALILHSRVPEMDLDLITASQEFLSPAYFGNAGQRWGYIDPARWNAFFDWMLENEFLPEGADNRAFVNLGW